MRKHCKYRNFVVKYRQILQKGLLKIMKLHEVLKLAETVNRTGASLSEPQLRAYIQELGIDLSNVYQELEMTSRFVDTHRDVSHAADLVQLHSHTFYEVLHCCSNSGIEYMVGTKRYCLRRGDIVFVPPGIGHRPLLKKNLPEPYRREVLWMSTDFVDRLSHNAPEMQIRPKDWQGIIRTEGNRLELLANYFHAGVREAEQKAVGWQAAVYANTIQLMVQLSRTLQRSGGGHRFAEKPELLDEVMAYIEQNLSNRITLTDTAKRFWVSESTIGLTFKQKMGVSFYHCVTQRRLIAAKSLILTGMPLEEVSINVGFSDYSSFYRAFKQEYGISPRQYRKLQDS